MATPVSLGSDNKNSHAILNSISLNASRERMNELFKDFKKLNEREPEAKLATSPLRSVKSERSIAALSTTEAAGDSAGESLELVKSYQQPAHKLTALYVGDLDSELTEEKLYTFFDKYKSLSSVKICYSPETRLSLGYGYVNFDSEEELKLATEELNYARLLSKEIRIMPSLKGRKKSFLGSNVFVSNLNTKHIDSPRCFYETFKRFGQILSCKVDLRKRQGFVSFKDRTTAENFVNSLNDTFLLGSRIFCSLHIPKSTRARAEHAYPSVPSSAATLKQSLVSPPFPDYTTVDLGRGARDETPTVGSGSLIEKSRQKSPVDTSSSSTIGSNANSRYQGFKLLYLKGLPDDATVEDVKSIFANFCEVSEVFVEKLDRFKYSWAMVTLKNSSDGPKAAAKFHRSTYKNCKITCVKALKRADRQRQLEVEKSSFIPTARAQQSPVEAPPGTYKLHLYNLPPGTNENFFKMFLKNYTFQGEILKYYVSITSSNENTSYIEFSQKSDARGVLAKLDGVELSGYTLKVSIGELSNEEIQELKKAEAVKPPVQQFHHPIPVACSQITTSASENGTGHYMSPLNQQLVSSVGSGLFRLVPVGRPSRINSNVTTVIGNPSVREHGLQREPVESIEYLSSQLERIAPRYIDFLKYPVATRPRNIKRVVKFLVVTYWYNDLLSLKKDLTRLQALEPDIQTLFKKRLTELMEYFGFER